MEGIKTNIPANLLVGYVMTHEVAWQICDSLMEFSHIGQTRADIEEKEVQNKGLITILELVNRARSLILNLINMVDLRTWLNGLMKMIYSYS